MKSPLSILFLGLATASVMSCKSPTAPAAQADANPAPAEKPADPLFDTRSLQSSYWQRAMAHYKPPAQGDFATLPEESEAPSAAGAAPAPAAAPSPIPEVPPAMKPPPLKAEELPIGTRIPGQPGLVKSPYDPQGRSVDVRDFSPGQMARCPYSGKVFRVPPK
jgi:hypothetical protein